MRKIGTIEIDLYENETGDKFVSLDGVSYVLVCSLSKLVETAVSFDYLQRARRGKGKINE